MRSSYGDTITGKFSFDDYDSETFSRFEVEFDPLSLIYYGVIHVCFEDNSEWNRSPGCAYGNFPGIAAQPTLSTNYASTSLNISLYIRDYRSFPVDLPGGIVFVLNKYKYRLPWDCSSGSLAKSSPCKWYGTFAHIFSVAQRWCNHEYS
jgi:hypothetical protein